MKVYDYHQSMLARNVMGRMEVILHTRGSVMMVETNSRSTGTGQREGTLQSMIGWGKGLVLNSN